MTDFLTRLAERAQGLAPQVRPLLASRYAPSTPKLAAETIVEELAPIPGRPGNPKPVPAPALGEAPPSTMVPAQTVGSPTNIDASLTGDKTAEPDAAYDKPGALDVMSNATIMADALPSVPIGSRNVQSGAPDTTIGLHTRTPRIFVEEPAIQAATLESNPTLNSPLRRNRPGDRLGRVAMGDVNGNGQRESSSGRLLPMEPESVPSQPIGQVLDRPRAARSRAAPAEQEAPSTEYVETNASVSQPILRPVVSPLTRRAERAAALDSSTAATGLPVPSRGESGSPPVIRVTIGRVEVRSVQPTPAYRPTAPAPARPVLTLDEYLKQRREGKR